MGSGRIFLKKVFFLILVVMFLDIFLNGVVGMVMMSFLVDIVKLFVLIVKRFFFL